MSKKYYAVKKGYKPGIYENWDECKKQVDGFPGASYKSFPTYKDAEEFLGIVIEKKNTEKATENSSASEAVAYVDGSYDDNMKTFAYGVVMFYGGKEEHFSERMDTPELLDMRNVAGEIKASERAMQFCIDNNISSIDIYHDYEGIAKWCTGEWKANKPGTIAYKNFYDGIKDKLHVNFVKVKGHSGDKYNDIADQLAKNAIMEKEKVTEEVGKSTNVYIDRASIDSLIQEMGQKEWGDKFVNSPICPAGNQQRCKFSVDGNEAALDFYLKTDGSVTLRTVGSDTTYSERLKELIVQNSFKNEHENANCKFSNVTSETYSQLIDYLKSLEKLTVLEEKTIDAPAHHQIKYRSTFGDTMMISKYDSGTLLFQGNPAYILTEAMYFMTLRPEISEEEISTQQKVIYKAATISVPEARKELQKRIPIAYGKLDEIILKILSPTMSLSKSVLEAEEYSCYVFPALRALEAVLLDLLLKKNIIVNPQKRDQNLGAAFSYNNVTNRHVLTATNKTKVSDPVYEQCLEDIYNYFKQERHTRFHANQVLVLTTLIFNKFEADVIINDVLDIIEETAKKIM